MNSISDDITYEDILKKNKLEKGNTNEIITNTRIGDKNKKIYGASYNITYDENFWDKYYEHVFVKNNK